MSEFKAASKQSWEARLRTKLLPVPLLYRPALWLKRAFLKPLRDLVFKIQRRAVPADDIHGLPRDTFSDLECIERGDVEGEVILRDQGSPALPNPSIMLLCKRTQHLQQPWPVLWSHHRNIRLIGPGLVHINGKREISLEAAYGNGSYREDPAWLYAPKDEPVRLAGPWMSLLNRWTVNNDKNWYAHWLLDVLPRLAVLDRFPPGTRILVPPREYRYQVESLKLLGLWERCRRTPEQHLEIEDYYFSSPPSMIVCHSPYAVKFLRSAYLPLATKTPSGATPKRFFIRRTSQGRNMQNEQDVLDYFRGLGWTIVDTAELGFLEQIQWFANAEAVCAIHGSGTANMVWCSPGCRFIEMFAADYLAGDQEWIAQCVQVDYHFMIFPCDYKLDAMIDLGEVRRKLTELSLA